MQMCINFKHVYTIQAFKMYAIFFELYHEGKKNMLVLKAAYQTCSALQKMNHGYLNMLKKNFDMADAS